MEGGGDSRGRRTHQVGGSLGVGDALHGGLQLRRHLDQAGLDRLEEPGSSLSVGRRTTSAGGENTTGGGFCSQGCGAAKWRRRRHLERLGVDLGGAVAVPKRRD